MKTKNFPGRKNIRRAGALERALKCTNHKNPDNIKGRKTIIKNTQRNLKS